jgi:hypothetical protein
MTRFSYLRRQVMDSWHSYPSIANLGHRALEPLLSHLVNIEEKVDGCVTPDTPILKSDLTYVPAGTLKIGDRLVGFSDKLNDPRLEENQVTHTELIEKECYLIKTKTRQVTASFDHPWLVGHKSRHSSSTNGKLSKSWVKTKDLNVGDSIVALPIWEKEESWDSGYIAGFYDGEGSLVRSKNQRVLSTYQVAGPTIDYVVGLLQARGFHCSLDIRPSRVRGFNSDKNIVSVILRDGTWTSILRFLGMFCPIRLLEKAKPIWDNAPMNFIPREDVLNIEPIGIQTVVGLSTSTGTYTANGMLCHNSQFSFGRFNGVLRVRSKGKEMVPDAPEKMFAAGVEAVSQLDLHDGWTYRGEYLRVPKHNALTYKRIPANHIILFDVNTAEATYLSYEEKAAEAERLGLEVVPLLLGNVLVNLEVFKALLDRESVLGGTLIEGMVFKPIGYDVFGPDHKCIMGKHVSEAFKEKHRTEWKAANPGQSDVVQNLITQLKTEARWHKAVQHLRDAGELENDPRDIGKLLKAIGQDVLKEEEDMIREQLFKWAWPKIQRGIIAGFPEWYKNLLVEAQLSGVE